MKIFDFARKIKNEFFKYENSIEVLISEENLLHNLNEYKNKYKDISFAPVLKSNAYGHGLLEVAEILDKENLPFFVVDSLYEARLLKTNSIKKDILIIGYTRLENIKIFNSSQFIFTVISLDELKNLSKNFSKKIRIHLKIDTGMHRQGIMINEINEAVNILKENKNSILEGVCSHFADADNQDKSFTESQIANWKNVVEKFKKNFETIKYFHTSATAGSFYNQKDFGNLIRLGIGIYGVNSSPFSDLNLKPVMRIEAIISSVRNLKKGEGVGYNQTLILEKDSKVATVTMGYFEGVDRRLSNLAHFKIGNNFCKILGRVSMNMSSIDVTDLDVKLEDKVIVLSEKKEDLNSLVNLAKLANTIPYDILVHIMPHLKRKVVKSFNKII